MACDAEDCGFQMLNDDEIVTSVQEESDPVDDETDEDENNTTKWPVSYTAWIAFDFRLSERYPVPTDSDKRRSTVFGLFTSQLLTKCYPTNSPHPVRVGGSPLTFRNTLGVFGSQVSNPPIGVHGHRFRGQVR
ncbi:uncharacterized protein TNCV_568571 [Trichonephila clavipes]|nr:uncharacterized protein TNCV_568571 [Trichonephila clavipes]